MIDFVKILVKDINYSKLSKNPLLIFCHVNINAETGEVRTTNRNGQKITPFQNAYYRGLEFRIYENGTVTIAGSLHKYWNNGAHNYNDFNYRSFLSVLNDLKAKFDINPSQCILRCLEVGINLLPIIPTNEILNSCLLHKTKPFEYQKNSDEGKYKQVQHSQYIIKIYDKARHYKSKGFEIETEIMRFEIKYTKMQKVNAMGVFTLADITTNKLQNKFRSELLNEWKNILFYDKTIQIDTLIKKVKNRLLKYSNQTYWTDLLENNQNKNFHFH